MGMHFRGSLSASSGIPSFSYREIGRPGYLVSGVEFFRHSSPSQCHRVAALQELAHISPVSLKLMKSWYSQIVFASSHTLGSFCRIQRALGVIHSADIGPSPPQLTRIAGSPLHISIICSVCEADRASIHSRHLRSGSLLLSKATTEQQVVSTQIQQISYLFASEFSFSSPSCCNESMADRTDFPMHSYQSIGSCSAHPGFG
mmetsp:Transcript_8628/g.18634  ORF Transcript_8628/g.18634 Transcript_8628/m.18634 type:complete len:202 (-) Transcript_8628:311-916(-)